MGKILPILMALIGIGAGIGAGIMLKPEPSEAIDQVDCVPAPIEDQSLAETPPDAHEGDDQLDYVKLNNQFVVPVVESGKVSALVVMSISLEVKTGGKEVIFEREPKIRDAFLQVLFDHANAGGFEGVFTSTNNMTVLTNALLEIAIKTMGPVVTDVLVTDIVRQDV